MNLSMCVFVFVCVCVCVCVCVYARAHHLHCTGFSCKNTHSDNSGLKLYSRVVVEHNTSYTESFL